MRLLLLLWKVMFVTIDNQRIDLVDKVADRVHILFDRFLRTFVGCSFHWKISMHSKEFRSNTIWKRLCQLEREAAILLEQIFGSSISRPLEREEENSNEYEKTDG